MLPFWNGIEALIIEMTKEYLKQCHNGTIEEDNSAEIRTDEINRIMRLMPYWVSKKVYRYDHYQD
jgi:hypothetical protein